jgi:hypothetical protein
MGNNFLADIESKIWEASNDHDFVTLFPRELEEDAFTKLLHGSLLDIYHRTLGGSRRKVRSNIVFAEHTLWIERKNHHTP